MTLEREVMAIRTSVAVTDAPHVQAVRISGGGAFDALDRLCPRDLYIQDGQGLHTLLLDDEAHTVGDVYMCADGDDFLVLGEVRATSIFDWMKARIAGAEGVDVQDLGATHAVVSLNGPYAWELLGDVLTPDIIGLPYLGFFHADDITCLRAGKTGEYGYDLLVPRQEKQRLFDRLVDRGAPFDLGVAGLDALDACALENWFFNIRREGGLGLTPIELQLQWRVSYRRSYPGSAALLEHRRRGVSRRTVLVEASAEIAAGDAVVHGESAIGEVLVAERSCTLGAWLGIALVDTALAHAGIPDFQASGHVPIRTVSAPPVDNRSLYVDPQRHSYATRQQDSFPPIRPVP